MKTLHLSIIAIVGIIIIITTSVGVFMKKLDDNSEPLYTGVMITGMKESYTVHEPIIFSVMVHGYGSGCGDTKAILTKENDSNYKSQVWGVERQCTSFANPASFEFNGLSANIAINQTGNYTIMASFDDSVTYRHTMAEKKFSVTAYNITGIYAGVTPMSTVLPHNDTFLSGNYFYYGPTHQSPKVELYDYSYDGIDKDGLVTIGNQTFYQTTLSNDIYKLKDMSMQFHNVTFSFPEGTLTTPGGAFVILDVKFQDGFEEIYGGTMSNPDGSGSGGGIPIPTPYGPHVAANSITVLGNHTMPQAGLTIYHDKVKLLVSADNQTSPTIPQCVSNIQNQYAIAGPRGDPLCPVVNFQASGKIVNYTGFYGVYGYSEYAGTPNFVLEPGHNGTLSYEIGIGSIYNWGNEQPANSVNITNDIEFMHDAGMNDHPGVTTSVDSKSEIIKKNGSALVTITFAADKDARPGTYWVNLPPSLCAGGETVILTITNCEK